MDQKLPEGRVDLDQEDEIFFGDVSAIESRLSERFTNPQTPSSVQWSNRKWHQKKFEERHGDKKDKEGNQSQSSSVVKSGDVLFQDDSDSPGAELTSPKSQFLDQVTLDENSNSIHVLPDTETQKTSDRGLPTGAVDKDKDRNNMKEDSMKTKEKITVSNMDTTHPDKDNHHRPNYSYPTPETSRQSTAQNDSFSTSTPRNSVGSFSSSTKKPRFFSSPFGVTITSDNSNLSDSANKNTSSTKSRLFSLPLAGVTAAYSSEKGPSSGTEKRRKFFSFPSPVGEAGEVRTGKRKEIVTSTQEIRAAILNPKTSRVEGPKADFDLESHKALLSVHEHEILSESAVLESRELLACINAAENFMKENCNTEEVEIKEEVTTNEETAYDGGALSRKVNFQGGDRQLKPLLYSPLSPKRSDATANLRKSILRKSVAQKLWDRPDKADDKGPHKAEDRLEETKNDSEKSSTARPGHVTVGPEKAEAACTVTTSNYNKWSYLADSEAKFLVESQENQHQDIDEWFSERIKVFCSL